MSLQGFLTVWETSTEPGQVGSRFLFQNAQHLIRKRLRFSRDAARGKWLLSGAV